MSTGIELGESVAVELPHQHATIVAPLTYGRPGPPGPEGPPGPGGSPFSTPDPASEAVFNHADADSDAEWAGADVADNMRLNDGRDLFVWGDTFISDLTESGDWSGSRAFHQRSITIVDRNAGPESTVLYDANSALLTPLKTVPGEGVTAGEWHWFGGLAGRDGGNTAYAFAQGMTPTDGPAGWNYVESRRTALAVFDVSNPANITLTRWDEWARTDATNGVIWGDCALIHEDYIYVTGRTPRDDFKSDAYIVRVLESDPWGPQEVWDGLAWTVGATPRSIGTFPSVPSGIRKIGERWYGLVAPFYAEALELWSAPALTGPWSKVADVWHYPNNEDVFYYSPRWVPQWDDPSGLAVIVPHNSKSEPIEPWEYTPDVIRLSRLVTPVTDPGAHTHTSIDLTDSGSTGRDLIRASTPDEALDVLYASAGTSAARRVPMYSGNGFPEGVVEAEPGAIYADANQTNGARLWLKKSGTGASGWIVLNGDTGWRSIEPADLLNGWTHTQTDRAVAPAIKRIGGLVYFRVRNLDPSARTSTHLYNVPQGFGSTSADGHPVSFESNTYHVSAFGRTSDGLANLYCTATGSTVGSPGSAQWDCDEPWPAVLPGQATS